MARKSLTLVRVGPVTTRSPSAAKKSIGIVVGERRLERNPAQRRPARCVSGQDDRSGIVLGSVDAVGVAGERRDSLPRRRAPPPATAETRCCARRGPGRAPSPWSRRPTAAPPGSVTASAPTRKRPARKLQRNCGMHEADIARLALDAVAEHDRCDSRRQRRVGGGVERLLRAGDQRVPGAREQRRRRASASRPPRRRDARDHRSAAPRSGIWRARRARRRRSSDRPRSGPRRSPRGRRPARRRSPASRHRAGAAAAASRPPLIAERCLRTALISPIVAPQRSKARVTACLSSSVMPGAGRASSAEPPPEMRQTS